MCPKNSPNPYFLLQVWFFPTTKSGSRGGGGVLGLPPLLPWLSAVLVQPLPTGHSVHKACPRPCNAQHHTSATSQTTTATTIASDQNPNLHTQKQKVLSARAFGCEGAAGAVLHVNVLYSIASRLTGPHIITRVVRRLISVLFVPSWSIMQLQHFGCNMHNFIPQTGGLPCITCTREGTIFTAPWSPMFARWRAPTVHGAWGGSVAVGAQNNVPGAG